MNAILQGAQRLALMASSRIEIMAAVLIMAVVFMMILPLPTVLLDAFIAFNISISALLVMLALYLPGPLAFSSFPAVLLLTTLFRLAISVATTRLILLQGDAGHIVEAFGNFVVGGNLVVGLVVFLILTVVQFIVITKGSERVAEVAARFTLDGMPGKQMSIDSDLRANLIDAKEAGRRRTELERESQLFGAMDGAMKFVKGDAIAGLIIVTINMIGGFAIGMLQRDMSAGQSIHTYSILSIGDGLIAQIPALLISITAGMIITRVNTTAPGAESNIGKEISEQLLAQPRALYIASTVMLGFAVIPGMPGGIFGVLALTFATIAFIKKRFKPKEKDQSKLGTPAGAPPKKAGSSDPLETFAQSDISDFSPYSPLVLEVAPGISRSPLMNVMQTLVRATRNIIVLESGVPIPKLLIRESKSLTGTSYRLMIHEVPARVAEVRMNVVSVRENVDSLRALGFEPDIEQDPIDGSRRYWLSENDVPRLEECGISYQNCFHVVSDMVGVSIRKRLDEFLGIQEVSAILTTLERESPELVKEINRVIPVGKLSEVLQRLVSEGISIRNARTIMATLIDWAQKERDTVVLTEQVRIALRQQICHQYSDKGVLPAYVFSPEIEDLLRNAVRQTSMGSFLALDPQTSRKLLDKIRSVVGDVSDAMQMPVFLVPMDLRRYLRKLIEPEFYRIPVLSYTEIIPELSVQPLARIEMS